MKIGKIWDSEFPWDVRVEKVCAALRAADHEVHLVCRNRDDRPLRETWHGVEIHRMPFRRDWPVRLERLSSFPAFVNPRWSALAERVFGEQAVDVILCRDLPLAPMAVAVGRRLRVPVIVDVAEHYPGLLRDLYNWHDFRLHNLLVRNPWLAAAVERWALPRADGILVVVEEMARRLEAMGVASDRIALVSNTPPRERLERLSPAPVRQDGGPLRLVYLGKVERSRGLGVVIEALADAASRDTLDVFGSGSSLELHRREVAERGLEQRVTFHGWRPYDEILARLGEFDVGVIPHFVTDHWNYTVQNKLFDYMSAGLPVLVSSMPPAARIVRETGAGRSFLDRDVASLRSTLRTLDDPVVRRRMSDAGRRAVAERFNWHCDAERMVALLERIVGSGSRRADEASPTGGSRG